MNKVDMDNNIAIACKVALRRGGDAHGILKTIEELMYQNQDGLKNKLSDDEWKFVAEPIIKNK